MEEDGVGCGSQCFIEGDELGTCFPGEGGEIGVGPCFRRGGVLICKLPKTRFERGWLLNEMDLISFEPVVCLPSLPLREQIDAHNCGSSEQTKQSELCDPTEGKIGIFDRL